MSKASSLTTGRHCLPLGLLMPHPSSLTQLNACMAEQDQHPGEPKGMRLSSVLSLSRHVTFTEHILEALLAVFHFIYKIRGWLYEF